MKTLLTCVRRRKIGRYRTTCTMLSTCELYRAIQYRCVVNDAVYLYLRTVNQTLAEGNQDYRDGRLIRNRTIGQRFASKFNDNGLIYLRNNDFNFLFFCLFNSNISTTSYKGKGPILDNSAACTMTRAQKHFYNLGSGS